MRPVPWMLSALLLSATIHPAQARITSARVDRVEPFADGASFGTTGAYERVIGVARGELDPADRRNAGIIGIDRAARNAGGKVEYETDLFILRPVDPAKGNHHLLFDVLNRGNKLALNWLGSVAPKDDTNDPRSMVHAGNGFLFRQGYTIAWTGWDPDSPATNNGMTIRVPALPGVSRDIRDEFISGARGAPMTQFRLSYRAADLDQPGARLTQRAREADPPEVLPRDRWRFTDDRSVALLPEGTKPAAGMIYDLTYRATTPWVSGIGFAAQRDVAAFLKSGGQGAKLPVAIGFGISQSGRFLRDFLAQGFNQDEAGRKVFDGVLIHIAGIGGVFLNAEFAQPFRTRTQHLDHTMPENSFPFSTARLRDPFSGKEAALLPRDRFAPLLIESNTDAEYWQKGASLLATDPGGKRDVTPPPNTRLFLISGTQHGGRFGLTDAPVNCVNPRNPHDPSPAVRALLVALDTWVTTGRPAPGSRIPRLADKTLVSGAALRFPSLPGLVAAPGPNQIDPAGDWVHPKQGATPYAALVPAVDRDGNDLGGLKLPDMAAPLGTYTGFNLYKAPHPEGEMCDRDGSFLAFARGDADRAAGDPRASLAARYGSRERYVALVEASAGRLVRDRLLLAEDAERYVARAKAMPGF